MHAALRIAVHCWQNAPDVVPDMPQMMLLPTADIIQRLLLDGAVIGTFKHFPVCSVWTTAENFVTLHIFSSSLLPSPLTDGWARLMRCYRVHMGQIPVYHGKTLRRVRCNSMSASEVERCAVIVGWEVGLACKSEGSPVTGLITLIRSIWSLYHSPPLWYIAQNWDNMGEWIVLYKLDFYWWVGVFKAQSFYPT